MSKIATFSSIVLGAIIGPLLTVGGLGGTTVAISIIAGAALALVFVRPKP